MSAVAPFWPGYVVAVAPFTRQLEGVVHVVDVVPAQS